MEIPLSTASRPPTGSLRGAFPEGFMFGTATSAFQVQQLKRRVEENQVSGILLRRKKSFVVGRKLQTIIIDIRKDFEDYADFCFRTYGDRVKHWITICGPWSYAYSGYGVGTYAPGRGYSLSENQQLLEMSVFPASGPFSLLRLNTKPSFDLDLGDPGREPYVVAKTLLLAHAAAVRLYRRKYKQVWPIPYSRKDETAAQRAKDFMLGWFMEPLISGDYPKSMKALVGCRLPKFTPQESRMIKKTYDFIALNYYTANYAMNAPDPSHGKPHVARDSQVISLPCQDRIPIDESDHESSSIHVYPEGLLDYLLYVKNKYNDPKIYISENGIDQYDDPESPLPLWEALSDYKRVYYYNKHLSILKTAIDKYDVKVKGYFTWSLLDNFEWNSGLPPRFGHFYVDYSDNFKRYPKLSAEWFKTHLRKPLPFPPSWTPDKK
ncbi:hypothetical protein RJ640_002913 [Escallonia rubra]|uniref:Beta-glucosidase n=1 Tax=Escallonia rubra TaxID=112253 RepID=A0AA88R7X5_9ASTE|nr:hypothetical protein RJ640_002913 [Escallonia rubra]